MSKEQCLSATAALSFIVGGLLGVGIALLMVPQGRGVRDKLLSAVGRKEKLTREQIIEEGLQCAVPEGVDICYPQTEEATL